MPDDVPLLIGTLRRECLDRTLFWTTTDLEAKLLDFQHYYNERRTHAGGAGAGRQLRLLTSKSRLLPMAEALSRLIPNADCRMISVIRHQQASLRRMLAAYFDYYHRSRTHLSLGKDSPESRPVQLPDIGSVASVRQVGGLPETAISSSAQKTTGQVPV